MSASYIERLPPELHAPRKEQSLVMRKQPESTLTQWISSLEARIPLLTFPTTPWAASRLRLVLSIEARAPYFLLYPCRPKARQFTSQDITSIASYSLAPHPYCPSSRRTYQKSDVRLSSFLPRLVRVPP
jgi:hypothetical protein